MSQEPPARRDATARLDGNAIGTSGIVFLVLAAMAPLATVIGLMPLAFGLGNGIGLPGTYAVAGVILLCFAVGYSAMSRHITNAGAFYAYIARGLGRPLGVAAALIAVVSYNALVVSMVGGFAFFTAQTAKSQLGIDLPWEAWVAVLLPLIGFLGWREVSVSARVLAVALIVEIGVILVTDVAVLLDAGPSAFPVESFEPATVFSGAAGVALMYGLYSFVGFEATALFGEESKNPKRTVPRATYVAVVVLALFYVVTSWSLVAATGRDDVAQVALQDPGGFFFGIAGSYVGTWLTDVTQYLVVTSFFAAILAIHNGAARYFFALGRVGVLPRFLGRVHPAHRSPYVGSALQIGITAVAVAVFAAGGADPYLTMATGLSGLGVLGIITVQAACSLAVVGFFWRRSDRSVWRTVVAPMLAFAGLVATSVLILDNYATLTGQESGIINQLPWLLAAAGLGGLGYAAWMARRQPRKYAVVAGALDARVETRPPSEAAEARADRVAAVGGS